jgi:acetate kinase
MRVLVVNAGSSSLKLRVLDAGDTVLGSVDLPADGSGYDQDLAADRIRQLTARVRPGGSDAGGSDAGGSTMEGAGSDLDGEASTTDGQPSGVDAVGHRVVHGGTQYAGSVRIDEQVEADLRSLVDLAPLHQPRSIAGFEVVSAALPGVPAVACFDTAFHASMPLAATTYPVPAQWREQGVRRYGFHGLSHGYAARRAAQLLGRDVEGMRVVSCHLGAGASLAAVHSGRSVDTTMGFTPLDGLVMATRSGSVDPGLVLWLQQHAGLSAAEVEEALEHRSGLVGLAGSADMREVTDRAAAGDESAALAIEVYVHRLRAGVAAMAASLSGVDALVFTGGVGENSPTIRGAAAAGLGFLGVAVNPGSNSAARGDADVSAPGAAVATLVVTAREDLQIAREVRRVLST